MENDGEQKQRFTVLRLNNDELWNICEFLENKDLVNFLRTCKYVQKCIITEIKLSSDESVLNLIKYLKEKNCVESLSNIFYIPGKSYMIGCRIEYAWRRQGLLAQIYSGDVKGASYVLKSPGGKQTLSDITKELAFYNAIKAGMDMFLFVKSLFTSDEISTMDSKFVRSLITGLYCQGGKTFEFGEMIKILLNDGFKIDKTVRSSSLPFALHTNQFGISSVLLDLK